MDTTYNKIQLACLILLYCSLLVQSSNAVKPNNGPSGSCQDESIICKGSYLARFDTTCSGNQRFCSVIHEIQSTKECDDEGLPVITRDSWGARTSRDTLDRLKSNLSFFIIHHANGNTCSEQKICFQQMKNIQKIHQNPDGKDFSDIGYHYLIGGDGTVFVGRGWKYRGAHSPGYNTRSIGVCLLGDFMTALPSNEATSSLKKLHTCLQRIGALVANNSVFGHKDVRPTECPGKKYYNTLPSEEFKPFWHRIEPEMFTSTANTHQCEVSKVSKYKDNKTRCSGRVSVFCFVDDTRHVNLCQIQGYIINHICIRHCLEIKYDCRVKEGTCQDNTKTTCSGTWQPKLCPGTKEIVCCIPN